MFKIQELTPFIQESWVMGKPQVVREWVSHDTFASHKTRLCHSRAFTFSEWNTFMCEHVRPGVGKILIFPGTPCAYDLPQCNIWASLLPLNIHHLQSLSSPGKSVVWTGAGFSNMLCSPLWKTVYKLFRNICLI